MMTVICNFGLWVLLLTVSMLVLKVSSRGSFTTSPCLQNEFCTNCSASSLRKGSGGIIYCCQDCDQPPFRSKERNECACLVQDPVLDSTNEAKDPTKEHEGYPNKKHSTSLYNKKKPQSTSFNSALRDALSMMAKAVDKIDVRIRMIEETLGQVNLMRFGDAPSYKSEKEVRSQPENNTGDVISLEEDDLCDGLFERIGHKCIYVSSKDNNHRANWKDAQYACKKLGGNLAETLSGHEFLELTNYLSKSTQFKGYSYWLGGLYPGAIWVWLSNGKEVTSNKTYWTTVRLRGGAEPPTVLAGDISNGRCLALHYVLNNASYRFAGDECGFEKYFICEKINLQYSSFD